MQMEHELQESEMAQMRKLIVILIEGNESFFAAHGGNAPNNNSRHIIPTCDAQIICEESSR
jgi:hypothetical protein